MIASVLWGCGAPVLPPDVVRFEITDPQHHWDDALTLHPPVHLPQPADGPPRVVVVLRLPETGDIGLVRDAEGQLWPEWPPGTTADRVESREGRVLDVRGDSIDEAGRRWHHVARPGEDDPSAPLPGIRWPAGEPELAAIAVQAFVDHLRTTPRVSRLSDPEGHLAAVRGKLDCDGCHVPQRPRNRRPGEFGLVARGTDTAGWFTPATLFAAMVPLEAYGGVDPNRTDPHVTIRCPDGTPLVPGAERPRCTGRQVPVAALDVPAALAAGAPHALAYCSDVRVLAERMTPQATRWIADHPCLNEDAP